MMTRERLAYLRAEHKAQRLSYSECIEIDDAFAETAKAKRTDEEQPVMADDKLDEIEAEMNEYHADALAVFGPVDTTVRYLLIELPFDAAIDPDASLTMTADTSPLGGIAEMLGEMLQDEPNLADVAEIRQVYPGDVVAPDAVPDIFDLDLHATMEAATNDLIHARLALLNESEGDLKRHLAEVLDKATKLARFVGAM